MARYRDKVTGEIIEVPDRPASIPIGMQDPAMDMRAPKAGAELENTRANTQRTLSSIENERERLALARQAAANSQSAAQRAGEINARNMRQNPLSAADQAFINKMRTELGDMPAVLRDITAAQRAVDDFQPYPGKGILYSAGTPTDDDGPISGTMKGIVGAALPDKSQEDYQTLSRLQNASVLNAQIAQKGPQTESDAVRMKLTSVSPNKSVRPNAELLAENQYDAMLKMERPAFYTYWANKLGSTQALNSKGQTADQVWNAQYQRGLQRMRRDPRFKGETLGNARPRKQNRVIDWNDY